MSASSRCTFDTNVLFYAIDSSAGEKHLLAKHLFTLANHENAVIVLQTLGELFHSTHRKQPYRLPVVRDFIEGCFELFDIVSSDPSDLQQAMTIQKQLNIQFWDAMILVTAQHAECTVLLSEDFQDGQTFGTLTVRNPFKLSAADLTTLLS